MRHWFLEDVKFELYPIYKCLPSEAFIRSFVVLQPVMEYSHNDFRISRSASHCHGQGG